MSSRLAALVKAREQLLLDVSHELRSPLTRIKVALELTPEGTNTENIREDIREMETMIGEILEAARLDSVHGKLQLDDLDMGELVAEVLMDFAGRPPGVIVTSGYGRGERSAGLKVKADAGRIRKVLANVLDNACKFSQGKSAPVEVSIGENERAITVKVRDQGTGVPSDATQKLFEPFYRVDPSRSRETGGYGLGLSLCKRIMEAHGGSIGITSELGQGTEVTLIFPKSSP
jgi:signal transduction histidine kinase